MNFPEYEEHIRDLIQSNQLDQITRWISPIQSRLQLIQGASDCWLIHHLITIEPIGSSITEKTEAIWHTIQRVIPSSKMNKLTCLSIAEIYGADGFITWIERGWIDLKDPYFISYLLYHPTQRFIDPFIHLIDRLLEAGLNINDETSNGYTILCDYLQSCRWHIPHSIYQILPYLLEKGADPLLKGRLGQNAFDIVHTYKKDSVVTPWVLAELEKWA